MVSTAKLSTKFEDKEKYKTKKKVVLRQSITNTTQ